MGARTTYQLWAAGFGACPFPTSAHTHRSADTAPSPLAELRRFWQTCRSGTADPLDECAPDVPVDLTPCHPGEKRGGHPIRREVWPQVSRAVEHPSEDKEMAPGRRRLRGALTRLRTVGHRGLLCAVEACTAPHSSAGCAGNGGGSNKETAGEPTGRVSGELRESAATHLSEPSGVCAMSED